MPFVLLLLFALICLQPSWPEPPFNWPPPAGCAILIGTLIVTSWLSAWLISVALAWQMTLHPEQRGINLKRYSRWRRYHFIALLIAYLAALYVLGWGNFLAAWWLNFVPSMLQSKDNLPGFHVALLAPFFLGIVAGWERFYRVEKVAYELTHPSDHFLAKWPYVLMQVRHQFFLVVPPILLMVGLQVLYVFFAEADELKSDWIALAMIGIMVAALILMPFLLRVFLGLKPLPAGALRDRLESTARRLGFRFSNVLVWNTRHMMANALVTGFVPWVRYVVLTDRLIDELTPEEIEAVFGHEVGHIKHHHLFFYLAFFLTSFILLSVFWEQGKEWIKQPEILAMLQSYGMPREENADPETVKDFRETLKLLSGISKLAILGGYTLLCFGFISRRCERQADLYGSHTVSTDVFIKALEKVAVINGIPRDRTGNWFLSWQHPTIAQRVDFLEAMRDDPARIPQFHFSIALLKWSFFLALLFLVYWFGATRLWEYLKEF